MRGDTAATLASLERFLTTVPPSHVGWTVPIEPCFLAVNGDPEFQAVLKQLAERAQ